MQGRGGGRRKRVGKVHTTCPFPLTRRKLLFEERNGKKNNNSRAEGVKTACVAVSMNPNRIIKKEGKSQFFCVNDSAVFFALPAPLFFKYSDNLKLRCFTQSNELNKTSNHTNTQT